MDREQILKEYRLAVSRMVDLKYIAKNSSENEMGEVAICEARQHLRETEKELLLLRDKLGFTYVGGNIDNDAFTYRAREDSFHIIDAEKSADMAMEWLCGLTASSDEEDAKKYETACALMAVL